MAWAFGPPVLAPRSAASLTQASVPAPLRFEFYRKTVWVEARVGDSRPLHLQVDTAAGASVLNRATAGEPKLPILTEYNAVAGSGDNAARIAVHPATTIALGEVRLELPRIASLPLDEVARTYGTAIDGIIGSDACSHHPFCGF